MESYEAGKVCEVTEGVDTLKEEDIFKKITGYSGISLINEDIDLVTPHTGKEPVKESSKEELCFLYEDLIGCIAVKRKIS